MADPFSLRRLVEPVSLETFLAEYWEAKPLVLNRGQPGYFDALLSVADVDRVLTTLHPRQPDTFLVDARRTINATEYAYGDGLIDVARLYQHYADGATIVLNAVNERVPALGALCRAMEREVSARFQTNAYLTPNDAQGFKAHYDNHDVFVLQVHGSKHWVLYDTPVVLPYRGQRFVPSEVPVGGVTQEFDLNAGDVLYLPRGIIHDANTKAGTGPSLHVTLGVHATSWTDVLIEALAVAGLRDAAFRKALPPGFANEGFDRTAARKTFRQLFARAAEVGDFDAALDHFVDDFVAGRVPLLDGQRAQVERLGALTVSSKVAPRPDLVFRVHETADAVIVACYGARISFPSHVREAVRFALHTPAYAVGALPGDLDDAGKQVLVRRLVREGLVEIVA